jgi:iron complex outermembrane recepter protein
MTSSVRIDRRVNAKPAKDVLHGLWAAPIAWLMASSVATAQETSTTTLPEIRVIATTPVAPPRTPARAPAAAAAPTPARTPARTPAPTPAVAAAPETAPKAVPGAVELDKIPSNVQTVGASAFDGTKAPDLLQSLDRALPGVLLSSQTGNDFQLDLNYRGFTASPVIGTPQGLAVYQNGVRINEVFGDVVNWDFIPQSAINQLTLPQRNGRCARVRDEEWIHLSCH